MSGRRTFVTLAVLGAVAAGVVAASRPSRPPHRTGTSAGGMEYLVLGDGTRTMLMLPGGPGSALPTGPLGRFMEGGAGRYAEAGYTVWTVTRRRGMPPGHTMADMADDHAVFIREELGGHVDVVLGESYGGLVAMYLAARHPALIGSLVLAGAAVTIEEEARDTDVRWARQRAAGKDSEAGATFLGLALPRARPWLRRVLGVVAGRVFAHQSVPPGDLLVEAEAEATFDGRALPAQIPVPTLVVCGEEDEFFPLDAVRETAAGIAGSTLVTYPGQGHMATLGGSDLPRDVLAWLARRDSETAATPRGDGRFV